jgi:hypothetical protein
MKRIVLAAVLVLCNCPNIPIAFSAKAGIAPQNINCVRDYKKWLKRPDGRQLQSTTFSGLMANTISPAECLGALPQRRMP